MKRARRWVWLLFLCMFACVAAVGCKDTGGGSQVDQPSASSARDAGATAPLPAQSGPKRTVAVGKFTSTGAFSSKYGDWDIGGGLAAQLATALEQSDRFIVLERANLSNLLTEQELKAAGVTNPETGPELGRMSGVQFMIYGAVTEFGTADQGGGTSLGVSGIGGLFGDALSGGLSGQTASGDVAMDIRVVDTTTGEVIETHTVREEIRSSAVNLDVNYSNVSFGSEYFWKTPLGEATRRALNRAVRLIALDADAMPWTGQVVAVDGNYLYVNVGSRAGARVEDTFVVERVVHTFTDPTTGEVLGAQRAQLGYVQLIEVQDKLSIGSYQPILGDYPPQRGDYVVEIR